VGNGPIDAAFTAIERATGVYVDLDGFDAHNISVGEDAQGEVHLTVEHEQRQYRGQCLSTDIIEASAGAFMQAINRIAARQLQASPPEALSAGKPAA
ncbi:MAG: 2-isopropylmalate synthase, partial [Gammaproteobacteria bacterium]|nr:2-isopropylmalate synthase [Gammaproteobacteria bacterium]